MPDGGQKNSAGLARLWDLRPVKVGQGKGAKGLKGVKGVKGAKGVKGENSHILTGRMANPNLLTLSAPTTPATPPGCRREKGDRRL